MNTWLKVEGQDRADLQREAEELAASRLGTGEKSPEEADRIARMKLIMGSGSLDIDEVRLEKLRRLCQLWEVELHPVEITSHRPLIGPIIVAAKRLIYPVLRALFHNTLRQQREFNATLITLMADLCRQKHNY